MFGVKFLYFIFTPKFLRDPKQVQLFQSHQHGGEEGKNEMFLSISSMQVGKQVVLKENNN